MTPAAPYHRLLGDAPSPAQAFWLRTDDNIRLRAALWRGQTARGTVLLFSGRTEYLERYDAVAHDLVDHGYAVLGIDWRGQGASDRLIAYSRIGHIDDFADYQRDVVELISAGQRLDLPQPWHMLAHSMGGAIGLAALYDGLPVVSAAFSAPMWGIRNTIPMPVATTIAEIVWRIGLAQRAVPGTGGTGGQSYVLSTGFYDNKLTPDARQWGRLVAEADAWPALTLGGASFAWVRAALRECRRLSTLPAPNLPAIVSLGSEEMIVSSDAIRDRVASWPGLDLIAIDGARHEVLFDAPMRVDQLIEAALALFDHADRTTSS